MSLLHFIHPDPIPSLHHSSFKPIPIPLSSSVVVSMAASVSLMLCPEFQLNSSHQAKVCNSQPSYNWVWPYDQMLARRGDGLECMILKRSRQSILLSKSLRDRSQMIKNTEQEGPDEPGSWVTSQYMASLIETVLLGFLFSVMNLLFMFRISPFML